MTEDFVQYSDRTYKMLKGLRKFSQDGYQETSCMEVPEKRNRALLPKYGQAIRAHCPQKGEILTKKITDHEIIWLEYEEENSDCFESDVLPVTQSIETNRLCYSERCDEYINYFKMLSSYSYESSLAEYQIEMIFDEQKLRELESDRFNILRMLLKSPNTRQDGPSTRADKYDENIHVVNTDLCMGQLNINEKYVANVKEQMRTCLRHAENTTNENITSAATSEISGERTSKPYSKSDGAVTDVKEHDIPVGITDECQLHVAACAIEETLSGKNAADLTEQNKSTVTVTIDKGEKATKADKCTLSCNSCTDKKLNSSAITSDINGSKAGRKPVEVIGVTVPVDVKEHISVALTVHTDLHETERKPAENHDDATVTTGVKEHIILGTTIKPDDIQRNASIANYGITRSTSTDAKEQKSSAKSDAENIMETEVTSTDADNITSSGADSVKANEQDSSEIVTMGDGSEALVIIAEAVDDTWNLSSTDHTNAKKQVSSEVTVAAHDHQTETKPADAGDGNFYEASDAMKQLHSAVTVTSDDSENDATVAEIEDDILSINDTIDDKSNATECDIDSLSDLSRETDEYYDNEIDNHADVINPPVPTKETEDTEDEDSGLMCGILWEEEVVALSKDPTQVSKEATEISSKATSEGKQPSDISKPPSAPKQVRPTKPITKLIARPPPPPTPPLKMAEQPPKAKLPAPAEKTRARTPTPTPPPRAATPLPGFITQFKGTEWFEKFYPNCNETNLPKPWSLENFVAGLVRLMKSADYKYKTAIVEAILMLHAQDEFADTLAHSVIKAITAILNHQKDYPTCMIEDQKNFIVVAIKAIHKLNDREFVVEALSQFLDGDKEVRFVVITLLSSNGLQDPHKFLPKELDSWDIWNVEEENRKEDLRKLCQQWLDRKKGKKKAFLELKQMTKNC